MKSLVCLIVVLSLVFDAQSIHIKDPDPRVLFQFSQGNPAPGGLFTNSEICEGLVDFLRVFGTDAVSSYSTCQDQYILLGEQNSLIKEDQPACFLNLVPALCQYRIDTNVNEPHPSDLRYFITKTIQNCIKTKSEYTTDEAYICPTLNMQTQQVEEKEDFCKNLEAMNQYDPDQESDPTYKVYGFIGRDAKTPCVEIVELYNFCIFVTQKLNLDTDRCFTNKFTLYEDGGSLQKYGPQDMNICATLMLPYFSYNSIRQNILDPMNTFGFCDQINNRIVLELEARQGEIKQELTYQRGNQSIYEQNIEKLNDWKTNVPTIVEEISKIEEQWTSLYKLLTKHDTINETNVTIIAKSNIDLLNNTLADWVMTSRASLGFMKSFENDTSGASLLNYDQISENFNKIHLLSNHTLNFATFINQLMTNEVDDNSADNMVSKKADQTVKTEDLKAENVLFYEGKSNYGNFLTAYMGQTSKEVQINENKVNECKDKIEKLTKSLDAVFEQEQLSYKYFY